MGVRRGRRWRWRRSGGAALAASVVLLLVAAPAALADKGGSGPCDSSGKGGGKGGCATTSPVDRDYTGYAYLNSGTCGELNCLIEMPWVGEWRYSPKAWTGGWAAHGARVWTAPHSNRSIRWIWRSEVGWSVVDSQRVWYPWGSGSGS